MTEPLERTQRTVKILRALADWVEKHPYADVSLPGMWSERMFQLLIPRDRKHLAELVRNLGTCHKRPCANEPRDYEFVVDLLPDFELVFWCKRDKVCTARVVGQKLIPTEVIPEKVIHEHYEDVVEWDCAEPILASADEKSILEELSPENRELREQILDDVGDLIVQGPEYSEVSPKPDENQVTAELEGQLRKWAEQMKEYKD